MKKYFFILFCVFSSCTTKEKNNTHQVYLYYRDLGGNNGYVTYMDYVVIDNYEDYIYTIRQLFEIAKKYIDTVKSDKPVSAVTFVGKPYNKSLPKPGWDTYTEQKKRFLIGFGFENSLRKYANKRNPDANVISLWNDNTPQIFLSEKSIDSLLNMQQRFSNNFGK